MSSRWARVAASGLKIGDAVYAKSNSNGFAEFVAVPAINVAPKPASLDYGQAATLTVAALTAWQGLFDHAGVASRAESPDSRRGGRRRAFRRPAAGMAGAYVIGTGSAGNEAFIRRWGGSVYRPPKNDPLRGCRAGCRRGVRHGMAKRWSAAMPQPDPRGAPSSRLPGVRHPRRRSARGVRAAASARLRRASSSTC
ncbi:MAG: hypothetical protein U0521_13020 [Anaerolineae bacterium]